MGRLKGLKYHRTVAVRLEEEYGVVLDRMAQEEDRPVGVMARILLDIKYYAVFIALIVSILSLCTPAIADRKFNPFTNQFEEVAPNSTLKYIPYTNKWGYSDQNATLKYNPQQNTWDMAPPDNQQKYNPMTNKWETASPESKLKYNPRSNEWKYVPPDVSPEYNPRNNQREYRW